MEYSFNKILVIQTAFIGDVILATGILEKLHQRYPKAQIHILVRQGNESLFSEHPYLEKVWVWEKNTNKYRNLWNILKRIREKNFDWVINAQRFANSGILTAFSRAKLKTGFDKNPFALFFDEKIAHEINNGLHEVERNHSLIKKYTDQYFSKPKLYPSDVHFKKVEPLKNKPFLCLAPASVWFTKQLPKESWVSFLQDLNFSGHIFLIGAASDYDLCQDIIEKSGRSAAENLCGQLNLLSSAALMKDAVMNYVNDSAPMHLASAVNAKTCAIFCSTIPEFGFGPLSEHSTTVQIAADLSCRPCGLHGKKTCPEGHFKCGKQIQTRQLTAVLN